MIARLIPRYPTFLILGFIITASALFIFTAGRDAIVGVWVSKLFDGETEDTLFKQAQSADVVTSNFVSTWLFVGLSTIKLGIGFAIATIVAHLRRTRETTYAAYKRANVDGIDASQWQEPWFGRWFTRLLFWGVVVVLFSLALTLWWNANTVLLKKSEFDGITTGNYYHTWVVIDQALGPVVNGVKFLGEGMVILGIAAGLSTIVSHLSFQSQGLAFFTRRAMGQDPGPMAEFPEPHFPWRYLGIAVGGATLIVLALFASMAQSGIASVARWEAIDGTPNEALTNIAGVMERGIQPGIVMGLGLLFFAIAFLLLTIVRYLRKQRQTFGDAVADLSSGVITRPTIEPTLWPTKLVLPLAVFGLAVVAFFFIGTTALQAYNFDRVTVLQFAGDTSSVEYQNMFRFDRIITPIIGAGRFIGLGALLLAIAMALVTIVINLRATAMVLPAGFGKLIPAARKEPVEEENLTVEDPIQLAPWNLVYPHLAGEAFIFTAMFPIAILFSISIHRMLQEVFSGAGNLATGEGTGLFKSSFLGVQIYAGTLAPLVLFGVGLILYSIGQFFSTIVSFVEIRRTVITEGVESISEIIAPPAAQPAGQQAQPGGQAEAADPPQPGDASSPSGEGTSSEEGHGPGG